MNVIGIVGSPRRQGNTEILVQEALSAAKEAGADEIEMILLADKDIHPCTGCDCCLETEGCVIDDDMQDIYPKLLAADGIIIGAPVYFGGICGLAKLFIDRTYCLAASHMAIVPTMDKAKFQGRKDLRNKIGGIVTVTARVGNLTVVNQINHFFRIHRMFEAGSAMAFALGKGEVVIKDKQGVNESRWTGRAVVREIKRRQALIKATK